MACLVPGMNAGPGAGLSPRNDGTRNGNIAVILAFRGPRELKLAARQPVLSNDDLLGHHGDHTFVMDQLQSLERSEDRPDADGIETLEHG